MRIVQAAFLGLVSLTTACASSTQAVQPQAPPRGGVLDFRLESYDGRYMKGRLLLGATIDPLIIDSRRGLWYSLNFENIRPCGKMEPLLATPSCFTVTPPQPDEIITLQPSAWYGRTVNFSMHNASWGDIGPDCFESELTGFDKDFRGIATLPIRVERTDKKAAPKAEGAKELNEPNAPKESTPDAPSPKAP